MTKLFASLVAASVLLAAPAFADTAPTIAGATSAPSVGHTSPAVAHKHHKHHKQATTKTSAKHVKGNKAKAHKVGTATPAPVLSPAPK